ncbi:8761_t:CDS:2 [Funneliformis geosporum]|uniref:14474_t:CDS:1 n=1 Tax=Funneliformis geosporum TaxID=1117311 RepID=A0A9W4WRC3_9GLOM|nr:14474_t:CDS:2 [Funneliformis geosporum]CAI2166613.1 8761_t:CDS:2 [Funneliformis geosporum]
MSTFPNEILQEIFNNVNDIKTLLSIVLVNRNWCRNGIKYLWKHPFRSDVELKKHIEIVPLLLRFIMKDKEFIKRFIYENYDKIMKEIDDEKAEQENDDKDENEGRGNEKKSKVKNKRDEVNPFNFSNEITSEKGNEKEVSQDETEKGFELDTNFPLPGVPEIDQIFGIVFTIIRIIIKRGATIEGIILRLDETDLFGENPEREAPTSIFHSFFDETFIDQFISRLDKLFISLFALTHEHQKMSFHKLKHVELSGCIYKNNILSCLTILSKNVKVLRIDDFNLNDLQVPLERFIKSQNQLEQIKIRGDSLGYIIDKLSNISGVISNLETQSNTLKKLKLVNANIGNDLGFEPLLKCKKLENLSLVQVNLKSRHLRIFNRASFPNLKTLKLDFIDYSDGTIRISNGINPFIKIMHNQNMMSNLDVLSIKYEGENNHKLLKGILENCNKNLTSFSGFIIENQDIPYLFSIIKKWDNLKKLSLTRSCRMMNFGFSVEMAKFLPKSLETLEFIHMVLSDSSLVGFFDNCKVELKKFRLNFHGDHQLDRMVYRGLIEKYSKEKKMVIKEFDMSSDSSPNLEFNVRWE